MDDAGTDIPLPFLGVSNNQHLKKTVYLGLSIPPLTTEWHVDSGLDLLDHALQRNKNKSASQAQRLLTYRYNARKLHLNVAFFAAWNEMFFLIADIFVPHTIVLTMSSHIFGLYETAATMAHIFYSMKNAFASQRQILDAIPDVLWKMALCQ